MEVAYSGPNFDVFVVKEINFKTKYHIQFSVLIIPPVHQIKRPPRTRK